MKDNIFVFFFRIEILIRMIKRSRMGVKTIITLNKLDDQDYIDNNYDYDNEDDDDDDYDGCGSGIYSGISGGDCVEYTISSSSGHNINTFYVEHQFSFCNN